MNPYFFVGFLCFLIESNSTFAQPAPSASISPQVANQLFGAHDPTNPKRELNCFVILNKSWAYPNAQVSAICNEAEISCVRLGVIQQAAQSGKGSSMEDAREELPFGQKEAKLKLVGCAQAIEATISSTTSILDASGYNPSTGKK